MFKTVPFLLACVTWTFLRILQISSSSLPTKKPIGNIAKSVRSQSVSLQTKQYSKFTKIVTQPLKPITWRAASILRFPKLIFRLCRQLYTIFMIVVAVTPRINLFVFSRVQKFTWSTTWNQNQRTLSQISKNWGHFCCPTVQWNKQFPYRQSFVRLTVQIPVLWRTYCLLILSLTFVVKKARSVLKIYYTSLGSSLLSIWAQADDSA